MGVRQYCPLLRSNKEARGAGAEWVRGKQQGMRSERKQQARAFSGSVGPESHCEDCGFYSGCDGNPR